MEELVEQHGRMSFYLKQMNKWIKSARDKVQGGELQLDAKQFTFLLDQLQNCIDWSQASPNDDHTDFTGYKFDSKGGLGIVFNNIQRRAIDEKDDAKIIH